MNRPRSASYALYGLSLKRWLIGANRQLDTIKSAIANTDFDDVFFEHTHLVPQSNISPFLLSMLALEDRQFYWHYGFEPIRVILRLFRMALRGKRLGGISTIDQQVVRIIRSKYERTMARKASEILLACLLNAHISKAQILHFYIHNAYFGYGLQGCEIASRTIFGKDCRYLNMEEACIISAALARPFPRDVVERINLYDQQDKGLKLLKEVIDHSCPKYGKVLYRRADYARTVSCGKFSKRFSK